VALAGFVRKTRPRDCRFKRTSNSRKGVERIIPTLFEYSHQNGLKRVRERQIHARPFAHDLWQRVFKEVRQAYTARRLPPSLYRHAGDESCLTQPFRNHRERSIFVATFLAIGRAACRRLGACPRPETFTTERLPFRAVHVSAPILPGRGLLTRSGSFLTPHDAGIPGWKP